MIHDIGTKKIVEVKDFSLCQKDKLYMIHISDITHMKKKDILTLLL